MENSCAAKGKQAALSSRGWKAWAGGTLTVAFLVTLVSGILIHLPKHGVVVGCIHAMWYVHIIMGFLMFALSILHAVQFWKVYVNMRRPRWFKDDTSLLIILTVIVGLTGLVKLVSPVRIPHLGHWHYVLGIAMSVLALVHLIKGFPTFFRLIRK